MILFSLANLFFTGFVKNMQINGINNFNFRAKYQVVPAKELAERIKQGNSYAKIAQELNVSEYVVERSVRNYTSKVNKADDAQIYELYKKEYTVHEIKGLLGYPIKYIQSVIDKFESGAELKTEDLIYSIMKKHHLNPEVLRNLVF